MTTRLTLISPKWAVSPPKNIVSYSTTCADGVSTGNYQSLNLGDHVCDDSFAVVQNRKLLPYSKKIHWLEQHHSNSVVKLPSTNHYADGTISHDSQHFCAVMTADCVPVLLCDLHGREVAALHAGWKGLSLKILQRAVRIMNTKPAQLQAWIGPAICQDCYEVPAQVANQFSTYSQAIKPSRNPQKFLLNLPLIAQLQLQQVGLRFITQSGLCTYTDERFFSHRRSSHLGVGHTGRQASVIGMID